MRIDHATISVDGEGAVHLGIRVADLFDSLDEKSRAELAEALCNNDEVIERVAQQIALGATDAGSFAWETVGSDGRKGSAIFEARKLIAERSSEIAKEAIETLTTELAKRDAKVAQLEADIRRLDNWYADPIGHSRRSIHSLIARLREDETKKSEATS